MLITQHYWQPRHGNETVRIRHKGDYTEVWMPHCDDAIIVLGDHPLNITMTDINPQPKKIEAVRVYENL